MNLQATLRAILASNGGWLSLPEIYGTVAHFATRQQVKNRMYSLLDHGYVEHIGKRQTRRWRWVVARSYKTPLQTHIEELRVRCSYITVDALVQSTDICQADLADFRSGSNNLGLDDLLLLDKVISDIIGGC